MVMTRLRMQKWILERLMTIANQIIGIRKADGRLVLHLNAVIAHVGESVEFTDD